MYLFSLDYTCKYLMGGDYLTMGYFDNLDNEL
jgi:hypothetical protein